MTTVAHIDWDAWVPTMRATLLFVRSGGRVLLIRKKTGLGKGKINAPGGKLEPGETPVQCAVREVVEEIGVTALDPVERGVLHFQFVDGLRLFVRVFTATRFTGTPIETREALPMWVDEDAIPYDEMWADDLVWLPRMLAGEHVTLHAVFDDDEMLDVALVTAPGKGG